MISESVGNLWIHNDAILASSLDELRRTVSDDGLLMEYLQVTTVGRTRIVPIGGSIRETVKR